MICKQCKSDGKTSRVYDPGGGFSTLMCDERYYDEQGKWHRHDPNGMTKSYSCSNGHKWAETTYSNCPSCDYNKDRQSKGRSDG